MGFFARSMGAALASPTPRWSLIGTLLLINIRSWTIAENQLDIKIQTHPDVPAAGVAPRGALRRVAFTPGPDFAAIARGQHPPAPCASCTRKTSWFARCGGAMLLDIELPKRTSIPWSAGQEQRRGDSSNRGRHEWQRYERPAEHHRS
jgi:hypothetical protein